MTTAADQPNDNFFEVVRSHRFVGRVKGRRQHRQLDAALEECRRLYNDALSIKLQAWQYLGINVYNGNSLVIRDRSQRVRKRVGAGKAANPVPAPPATAGGQAAGSAIVAARARVVGELEAAAGDRIRANLARQLLAAGVDEKRVASRLGVARAEARRLAERATPGRLAWPPEAVQAFRDRVAPEPPLERPWPEQPLDAASLYEVQRGARKGSMRPLGFSKWLTSIQHQSPVLWDLERHVKIGVFRRVERAFSQFYGRGGADRGLNAFPGYKAPGEFRTLDLELGQKAMANKRAFGRYGKKPNRYAVKAMGLPLISFAARDPGRLPAACPDAIYITRSPAHGIIVTLTYRILRPKPPPIPEAGRRKAVAVVPAETTTTTTAAAPASLQAHELTPDPAAPPPELPPRPAVDAARRRKLRARVRSEDRRSTGRGAKDRRAWRRRTERDREAMAGWQHRVSSALLARYMFIAVGGETGGGGAGPATGAATPAPALAGLKEKLRYKAAEKGGLIAELDLEGCDSICSACGHRPATSRLLFGTQYYCPNCAYTDTPTRNRLRNALRKAIERA